MSFRKRNVALSNSSDPSSKPTQTQQKTQLPGVKPSSIDGRPVTSTGTATLDGLLAGHGGLALGCSLLIEENGTTDYAGALLRFYAAEGILQGHHVHVFGLPESWGRELPGTVSSDGKTSKATESGDQMKIAWRYQSLGQFGGSPAGSRETLTTTTSPFSTTTPPYNHTFDLTTRLTHPASTSLTFHPPSSNPNTSPYHNLLTALTASLTNHPTTPHRLLLPSLLSPLLYPPTASHPYHLLPFLHSLRALLSLHPLTIITTLPLPLSPRSTGLTTWLERLHDGVIELSPFPHDAGSLVTNSKRGKGDEAEAEPQGLLRVHRLPVFADRAVGVPPGEGWGGGGDWAFTLSRRRFVVKEWRLGPVGEEVGGGGGGGGGGGKGGEGGKKEGMEF